MAVAAKMTEDEHAKEISTNWQNQLYDALRRQDVTQFSYVPDAGHRVCIDRSLADKDRSEEHTSELQSL